MKNAVLNLIDQLSMEHCLASSFKHFHTVGLNYICLHRSPELTAKLYIIRPNELTLNEDDYLVNPHSHRYNFSTWVLQGTIVNYWFSDHDHWQDNGQWHQFEYKTPLTGPGQSRYQGELFFKRLSSTLSYDSGFDSYYCSTDKIHTLWANPNDYTALFLLQYKDITEDSFLFMRRPELPKYDGLYQKYNEKEIKYLLDELQQNI